MQERIDLVVVAQEKRRAAGASLAVGISLVLHILLLAWFVHSYQPATRTADVPIARYVELMRQNPQDFEEAPGAKTDTAPITAALSDANRKASTPDPKGDHPTKRPGDGSGIYTPPIANPAPRGPRPRQSVERFPGATADNPSDPSQAGESAPQQPSDDPLIYRQSAQASLAPAGTVNWRNALRDVRRARAIGGGDGIDPGMIGGGDDGFAEQGPLAFETQWYDWGEYAQSMVSRIRVNWYANMPQIIRTGMQGVVTIRFTIHRDGTITDVTILKSSGVPPYDFAARKAIELSSRLNPLPKDFPNATERVTAMFYYNMPIPGRSQG